MFLSSFVWRFTFTTLHFPRHVYLRNNCKQKLGCKNDYGAILLKEYDSNMDECDNCFYNGLGKTYPGA